MILVVISSFFIRHYNHVPLIGIHDISALVWQEKLFSPPFFLLLMLVRQMTQTWILVIIFILFVIRHYNHFFLLGTWYWCFSLARKTFFPLFSIESKFIRPIRQTWILITISIFLWLGTTIMFSLLGYLIFMPWFGKNIFSFHYFP